MSIDQEVSNWVLEFLLRQPLPDRQLNSLIRALHLPDDKPTLTKSILLKKLESDASRDSVSESTLDVLEQLEEIEFRQGVEQVSDSMKRAYWAVAVECTLRVFANGDDVEGNENVVDLYRKFKFFEKVKKFWRRIEPLEKGGLGSDDLWIWKDEIEAALWDDNVLVSIKKKWEGVNAVEAVKDYVREERVKLAPSFVEVLADRVKDDEVLREILGMGSYPKVPLSSEADLNFPYQVSPRKVDQPARKELPLDNFVLKKNVSDVNNEIQKEQFHPGKRHVDSEFEGLVSRNSKRAKSVESEKMTTRQSVYVVARESKCDDPVEADRVEASSNVAKDYVHHDFVDDNLVEAIPGTAREHKCLDPVEEKRDAANLHNVDGTGDVQTIGCGAKDKIPKPSVTEPIASAPTLERGDPIAGAQDDPKDPQARHGSHSPRRKAPPLKKPENKVPMRRRNKRWSLSEEDALRKGVEKYGKGNWKFILHIYRDIFQERTDVDLKDKWRNMCRYRS